MNNSLITHMRDLLMGDGTIVLENVVIDSAGSVDNFLDDRLKAVSHTQACKIAWI